MSPVHLDLISTLSFNLHPSFLSFINLHRDNYALLFDGTNDYVQLPVLGTIFDLSAE